MQNIFVIDDKQENLNIAKQVFSDIPGVNFIYFMTRDAAIQALQKNTPDGIITDFDMPQAPGTEIIGGAGKYFLIKALMGGPPAVGITSHGDTLIYIPKEIIDPKHCSNPNVMPHLDDDLEEGERLQLETKEPTLEDCIKQIEKGYGEKDFLKYLFISPNSDDRSDSTSANSWLSMYATGSYSETIKLIRQYKNNLTKLDSEVWQDTWNILQKQIESRSKLQ